MLVESQIQVYIAAKKKQLVEYFAKEMPHNNNTT